MKRPVCVDCAHEYIRPSVEPCASCDPLVKTNFEKKPQAKQSNYNRIMKSPEELAKFITVIADCSECEEMHGFRMCDAAPEKTCEQCWCGWLREETKT